MSDRLNAEFAKGAEERPRWKSSASFASSALKDLE